MHHKYRHVPFQQHRFHCRHRSVSLRAPTVSPQIPCSKLWPRLYSQSPHFWTASPQTWPWDAFWTAYRRDSLPGRKTRSLARHTVLRDSGRHPEFSTSTNSAREGHIAMARPSRIPERGDIPKALVALRLCMSVADFDARRPELEKRGFPEPDSTSGCYAVEAVDRWRLRRYPRLFPELTAAPCAAHAESVFAGRLGQLQNG